jgi:hypothetical protein
MFLGEKKSPRIKIIVYFAIKTIKTNEKTNFFTQTVMILEKSKVETQKIENQN